MDNILEPMDFWRKSCIVHQKSTGTELVHQRVLPRNQEVGDISMNPFSKSLQFWAMTSHLLLKIGAW